MTSFNRFVNSHFKKVIRLSQIGNNFSNDDTFHNYYRLKKLPKGPLTYNGEYNCGITCFILGNILKKFIPIEMYKFETGYGKYIEDHVFLKTGNIIIDPTYRQFFTDNRKNSFSLYNNYLYEDLPPFFVSTMDDLNELNKILIHKNKEEFSYSIITNDVLDNWTELYNITHVLDEFHKLNEREFIQQVVNSNI